jgi:hypothetical protein
MGTVYLGTDWRGGQAAVKVLRDDHRGDQGLRRRFAREVVAVAAIDSPRVARLVDADPLAEQPWLATEYVPGRTLTDAVLADGPMSDDGLRALAVGVAQALRAIHDAGVVHRDLKPSNIMLAADGPKIIDFGIVAGLPETVTASGIVLGSLGYIAPELLVDGGRPSSKADIFAWALTLVFASTGRSPFGDGPAEALLYRTVNSRPDLRAIPASLRGLVSAALDKDPDRRPDASGILRHLEGAPGGLDHPADASAGPRHPARALAAWTGARRRRVVLPAAVAAAALAVCATVLVAEAPQSSGRATTAQLSPAPASASATSTVPAPGSPRTTAAPVTVTTEVAGPRPGEPEPSDHPSSTGEPPASEPGSGQQGAATRPAPSGRSRGADEAKASKPPHGRG